MKKFRWAAFIIKIVAMVVIWSAFGFVERVFYPVLNNQQAMQQMQANDSSFISFAGWQQIWGAIPIVLGLICVLLFIPEIKWLFKRGKQSLEE